MSLGNPGLQSEKLACLVNAKCIRIKVICEYLTAHNSPWLLTFRIEDIRCTSIYSQSLLVIRSEHGAHVGISRSAVRFVSKKSFWCDVY